MLPVPRAVAVVVVTGMLVAACTSTPEEPDREADGSSRPTTSTGPGDPRLDLSGLTVPRTDVCALLATDDVEQALDAPVSRTDHYDNGEKVEVRPGQVDIVHEYGCVFGAQDGTTARTWIFARPVLPQEARTLVRRTRRGRQCAFPGLVRFGTPSVTSVCEVGPRVRARLEGLFDDTWMGCEVSEPMAVFEAHESRADVVQRAQQWCTEVVTAINASA